MNTEVLDDVIFHVINACAEADLGAVKLNKVLYFADMWHYMQSRKPLTGITYRRRPHGPTSNDLFRRLKQLEKENKISVQKVDYFGYSKTVYKSRRNAPTHMLNEDQIAFLDEVIDFVCRKNSAKTISELSHTRAWESVEYGEVIPYRSASMMFAQEISDETLEWAQSPEVIDAVERSQQITVALKDYRDFRKGL